MFRLTTPDEPIEGGVRRSAVDVRKVKKQAMTLYWALKKYEDTGLTPKEIIDGKILTGWILVEEQLPKIGEPVVISLWDKGVTVGTWHGHRWGTALCYREDVLAWMPLPEPYEPLN